MKNQFFLIVGLFSSILALAPSTVAQTMNERCDQFIYSGLQESLLPQDLNLVCPSGNCTEEEWTNNLIAFFNGPINPESAYASFLNQPVQNRNCPWCMSRVQDTGYREMGFMSILSFAMFGIKIEREDSLQTIYSKVLSTYSRDYFNSYVPPTPKKPMTPDQVRALLNTYVSDRNSETQITYTSATLAAVCTVFAPQIAVECTRNLKRLVRLFNTGPSYNVGSPYLTDLLTSDAPAKGARQAAEKIATKMIQKIQGGDVYTDTYTAYKEEGYSDQDAEKWTWDLIFLAFVHGQNGYDIMNIFGQPYNIWVLKAAQIISAASVYLDTFNKKSNGHLYSFPKEVEGTCDNGKPYHFWVPAYAARESRLKGYSVAASKWAPYLMDLGYQMFSKSKGRDPELYLTLPPNAPLNLKIRLDLANSAAGVAYATQQKNISMSRAFDESLKKSKDFSTKHKPSDRASKKTLQLIQLLQPRTIFSKASK